MRSTRNRYGAACQTRSRVRSPSRVMTSFRTVSTSGRFSVPRDSTSPEYGTVVDDRTSSIICGAVRGGIATGKAETRAGALQSSTTTTSTMTHRAPAPGRRRAAATGSDQACTRCRSTSWSRPFTRPTLRLRREAPAREDHAPALLADSDGVPSEAGNTLPLAPAREPGRQVLGRHRSGEVVALRLVAAEVGEVLPRPFRLDALGHDVEPQVAGEVDAGAD